MDFGHLGLLVVIFLMALIVFGPKKMIEMVTGLVDALRQTRNAMGKMTWTLTGDDEPTPTPTVNASPLASDNVVDSVPPTEDK